VDRDGRAGGLLVDDPADTERTAASFRALTGSDRDHRAWLDFNALTAAVAERLFPTLTEPLPAREDARRLLDDVPGAWEALVERPLGETLAARFADPLVRGVVSTDAVIGIFARVDEPSLRQNACFLYHVIGGGDGRWRVPVGGMGALTDALAAAARRAGAELRTGSEVVALEHGERRTRVAFRTREREEAVTATWVLANVAPQALARLDGDAPQAPAPEGSQLKVNLLLDRLPRLRSGVEPEDAFAGTFRLNEDETELATAYEEAAAGRLPARPPAELYCHSLTDRSILGAGAPPGRHTLTLFGLHTPARLFAADNAGARATLVERCLDALDEHLAEPIRECIARDAEGAPCIEARTPLDLERELGLPGGSIFHGDLAFPWADDPAEAGGWGVATAHPRVVVCGSGARRGGGVSGIGGHNAAMHVLAPR
jgi:phytoene dehydrogenase-like protein